MHEIHKIGAGFIEYLKARDIDAVQQLSDSARFVIRCDYSGSQFAAIELTQEAVHVLTNGIQMYQELDYADPNLFTALIKILKAERLKAMVIQSLRGSQTEEKS